MALWRLVHHRIQARCILRREEPLADSREWLEMLNEDRPDLHMAQDAYKVSLAVAQAEVLLAANEPVELLLEHVGKLEILDSQCNAWLASIDRKWQPKITSSRLDPSVAASLPIPLPEQRLIYHDVWTARTWNYHRACLMTLNCSLISLKQKLVDVEAFTPQGSIRMFDVEIQNHQRALDGYADEILGTVPTLLGLIDHEGSALNGDSENVKDCGILFLLFPMWVIQRSEHASRLHKEQATALLDFVNAKMRRF